MNESESHYTPPEIKGNHVFMEGEENIEKMKILEFQRNSDIENAETEYNNAKYAQEHALTDEYADHEAAQKLVDKNKKNLDDIKARYSQGTATGH